ncbi:MAG TPA: efflux RND transporter periplasmic adaptor subunit [Dokdonella sp.]|uniref:efflux RND transporter periplasmic adaptor subunit n=1 Tax=Dokdonella sp. TaxID=2291710 RepID=UPI0025B97082|nr:efflux RND transporter periplasmic adaptor subunit [Dokdonella sp.]MBX3691234.1 efflux RND transporter periplasmic adaptor subunit [Dokdonella sp.]MCW5567619.1 efflux RND transporter periplasmic adaptor subunit [Dokdonella sp.]HNR91654.1 efflux RND transporter periplasmic adaptor subunit [Dokdonella sp.]
MQTRAYDNKPSTAKRMIIMLLAVLLLIGAIAGFQWFSISRMMANMPPPPAPTVTTTKVVYEAWQPAQSSVGTLRAVRGADLAFDVAGVVSKVNLVSGDEVKQGQVLVQLRDDDDVAALRQAEAAAALAKVTYDRAKRQLEVKAISQADHDNAAADLKARQATVQQHLALVAKKQLRAPFDGRAGIVTLSPGTYVNAGMSIVTVQQLDPVFVDFAVPQRDLGKLRKGQRVTLRLDAYGDRVFEGVLSAIDPKVDGDTRNARIEASVDNADGALVPGMFANVSVEVGEQDRQLTLPQSAITFNPYGETVFVVKPPAQANGADGQPAKPVAQQVFVTTGATRGDQIAVLSGLDEGTEVVTSGQLKLKNGTLLTIDNSKPPKNDAAPDVQEQ